MEGQSTRLWSVLRRMLAGILPGVGSAAETYHTPEHCMHIDNGDKQQVSIRSSASHGLFCIKTAAKQSLRQGDLPA